MTRDPNQAPTRIQMGPGSQGTGTHDNEPTAPLPH